MQLLHAKLHVAAAATTPHLQVAVECLGKLWRGKNGWAAAAVDLPEIEGGSNAARLRL